MGWELESRFRTKENAAIVAFLERENPSAHDDIATVLIRAADGLRDVQWYCPDTRGYAYVALHTQRNRIFGLAFGMSAIAFLLPAARIPEAVSDGGRVYAAIAEDWVVWQGFAQSNPKRWCKLAHDHAVREGA